MPSEAEHLTRLRRLRKLVEWLLDGSLDPTEVGQAMAKLARLSPAALESAEFEICGAALPRVFRNRSRMVLANSHKISSTAEW